jgi:phosphoglycolate phosphatase
MAEYCHILFDLDGTLSDPRPGVFASLQYALKCCGIREDDPDRLAELIGPPLWQAFIDRYGMSERLAARAYDTYCEHFLDAGIQQYTLYPGVEAMLETLRSADKELNVATSRETSVALAMLARLGLTGYFHRVVGESSASTADKAASIRGLLAGRSVEERASTVMVGDLESDVIAARANGLDSIAVTYGLGELHALQAVQPTHIVHSLEELQKILSGSSHSI